MNILAVYQFIIIAYIVFFTLIYLHNILNVRKLLILYECGKTLYVALWLLLAKPNQSTTGGSEQQRETAKDQKKLHSI